MNRFIRIIFVLSLILISPQIFAAGDLDSFEVILGKDSAKVGEALDITISAVDSNGEILTDYTGDILVFSESDPEAEFPNDLAENSYGFTTSNQGSVKFENAVQFNNPGIQDIYVYDLDNENVLGLAEVTITEEEKITNVDIEIISPENGVTFAKDTLTVSGKTQKNYQIQITINDSEELFTTSNSDGIFEKEITSLQDGTNTLQAFILDADNEVIGESDPIEVKINSSLPVFKSIEITPNTEIESGSELNIRVIATIGLRQVQVIINDVITELTEGNDGIYTAVTTAPESGGEYGVDLILRDDFGLESRQREVETLTITQTPDLTAGDPEPVEPVVTSEPEVEENVLETELDLTIQNIKVVELKTRSVISWDPVDDARSYNVYKKNLEGKVELIANVKDPRYEVMIAGDEIVYEDFAIKAVGQSSSGQVVQGDLSEMTKVKTGPEMYLLMLLAAMLVGGGMLLVKRKEV